MAGTFSQIYIQVVFAVKDRKCFIMNDWEERLYQYMTGIIRNKDQKLLAINGMPDHLHILIGMKPSCCLSDLVREIKKSSTEFIRMNSFTNNRFYWQEGFGAFSYGHSQLDRIINYIMSQKKHHAVKLFRDEYITFLQKYEIEHEERFLFDWTEYSATPSGSEIIEPFEL
jgi:REP element-mobilizing transposase RayT